MDLMQQQLLLEKTAVDEAREKYHEILAERGAHETGPGVAMIRRTIEAATAGIAAWQLEASSGRPGRSNGLAKFVSQFEPEELAFVALREVVRVVGRPGSLGDTGAHLTNTIKRIMEYVEQIDLTERFRKADPVGFERFVRFARQHRAQEFKVAIVLNQGKYDTKFTRRSRFAWGRQERFAVGARLVDIVCSTTGLATVEHDIRHIKSTKGKTINAPLVLKPTEQTSAWFEEAHARMAIARPVYYPTVVPPKPWTGTRGGGYYSRGPGYRFNLFKASKDFRMDLPPEAIAKPMQAVNILQAVKWRINKAVLQVAEEAVLRPSLSAVRMYQNAESNALPARHGFMDAVPREQWSEEQMEQFKDWKRATRAVKGALERDASKHFGRVHAVEVAQKMRDYEAIYFPHVMDWRGRCYPVPTYLQPQGSDLAKGLLEFGTSRPLGKHGVKWLAIHGANAFGEDKVPMADRVRWAREHHDEILADAENPRREGALWVTADSPWQFLAFAFEWARLAEWVAESGHGAEDFPSTLPVAIDGSCNGLQHFSAMLRDPVGGAATNLVPGDKPADVYGLVAAETAKEAELAMMDPDSDEAKAARFWALEVGISRRWTKRNTMTLPYGVTLLGMRDQIREEIGGMNEHRALWMDRKDGLNEFIAVRWLADANWRAINRVVTSAPVAMAWLKKVAAVYSSVVTPGVPVVGLPLTWTTPDGFIVQQEYRKQKAVRVSVLDKRWTLQLYEAQPELDRNKQGLGVSPNYVHSIDAAHMREVVRRCADAGVEGLMMVHDSFGTHAGDMEELARITRQSFVELHSEDLLSALYAEVSKALNPDEIAAIGPPPARGTLDLSAVLNSDYFFA